MIRALFFWMALASPLVAQDLSDPNVLVEETLRLGTADDMDGAYDLLARGLQAARTADALSPDWGIVFAMMVDMVRNWRENPAYALMLADEGLAVVAPNAAEAQDVIGILNVSRSYALADLGRLDEAVQVGRLAEPQLRRDFGDQIADDYLAEIATWEQGTTSKENGVSPMVMAERSRKDAEAALDQSDYPRALTLAAQAMLPQDSGLPAAEVLLSNADAMRLTGRALYGMGKRDQALDAFLVAGSLALGPDWYVQADPTWQVDVSAATEQMTDLMVWLARTLMDAAGGDAEYLALARRSADLADQLTPRGATRFTTAYMRSSLALAEGNPERARDELLAAAALARSEGQEDYALLAEFYVQTTAAAEAPTGDAIDTGALVAAADAAIDHARVNPGAIIDPGFVAGETAAFLVMTDRSDAALEFARQAFAARMAGLAASGGTGLGDEAWRQNTRSLAQTLLQAASRRDGEAPGANCPDVAGVGCVIIVENHGNAKD